jgi:hypothetical protein
MSKLDQTLSCIYFRTSQSNWLAPTHAVKEIIRIPVAAISTNHEGGWIDYRGQPIYQINPDNKPIDERSKHCSLIVFRTQMANEPNFAIQSRDTPKLIEVGTSSLEVITASTLSHPYALTQSAYNNQPVLIPDLNKMQQIASNAQQTMSQKAN